MNKADLVTIATARLKAWTVKYTNVSVSDLVDYLWMVLTIPETFTSDNNDIIAYLVTEVSVLFFDNATPTISDENISESHDGVLDIKKGNFMGLFNAAKSSSVVDRDNYISEGIKAVLEKEIYASENSELTEVEVEKDTEYNNIITLERA